MRVNAQVVQQRRVNVAEGDRAVDDFAGLLVGGSNDLPGPHAAAG
jgi:hypothetical protein